VSDDEAHSHFKAGDIISIAPTLCAEAGGVAVVQAMVMGDPIVVLHITVTGSLG